MGFKNVYFNCNTFFIQNGGNWNKQGGKWNYANNLLTL